MPGFLKPQNYSADADYRPPAKWYQRMNRVGVLATWLGLSPRDVVTLEVPGRRSGKPRQTTVVRTRFGGGDYLVSLSGESQWVRNLRAADGAATIKRRFGRKADLVELAVSERPPVILEYLRQGRERSGKDAGADQARFYFGLDPDPSLSDIELIADRYPVFRVDYEDGSDD